MSAVADLRKRAERLMSKGKMDEALGVLETALAASPDDARVWCDVGWALYDLDRRDEALMHLERALQIDPTRDEGWICIGMMKTDPEDAIKCYDNALGIDPGNWSPWFLKSDALNDLGRESEAEECLGRARALAPGMFGATRGG